MSPRPPMLRASFDPAEMIVDSFAGGGGASTGIAAALGRSPDIAINHSPEAIAMHTANHPETRHYREDIWAVDPREACAGRSVGLAWFSPDCTHFSRAKGGQPRSKGVRGLAHVVVDWARKVRPRVIVLENVEEFQTWGPLDESGQPIKARAGEDFRAWLAALTECGYKIEFRTLVAADYGTPTTRKRLFLVARCDGQPIVWPDATHGKGRAEPWRTAAEVIDWSLPCPSIFGRKRPLAEATLRRIAAGLRRFVIESPRPFIVPLTHHSKTARVHDIHDPFRTITAANRGELALVSPFIAPVTHTSGGDRVHPIDAPLRTVTTAKGGEFVLVSPTLIQTGYGERDGQAPRAPGLHKPLGTVVAGGQKHGLVAAFLSKHYGGAVGQDAQLPLGTVTARDHHSLSFAFMTKLYGTSTGAPMDVPVPTITAGGQHIAAVRAFLVSYYSCDGKSTSQQTSLFDPVRTITTKGRFGLVMVEGEEYQITDIGMRMLAPHELFAAQGFPSDYVIAPEFNGKPLTKTAQIELAGNSVCSQVARAVVGANVYGRAEAA